MCGIRTHTHRPCGCRLHYIRLCRTFNTPPCPSAPKDTSRFITTGNIYFSKAMLHRCPRLYIFPCEMDPYPCHSHWKQFSDPITLLQPPDDPEAEVKSVPNSRQNHYLEGKDDGMQADSRERSHSIVISSQSLEPRLLRGKFRGLSWSSWKNP